MDTGTLKTTLCLPGTRAIRALAIALTLGIATFSPRAIAADTNAFPNPAEILQGRTFTNQTDRSVFFLRAIRSGYPQHWSALLEANINEQQYIQFPDKLERFINELALATQGQDDPTAIATLRMITSDKKFYTNINEYHPEVLRAAARALIKMGPAGRKALADCFTESHYREDSQSLSELAKTVGEEKPADQNLTVALSATAFGYTTTNGGIYPRYTAQAVESLLHLPQGPLAVKTHLNIDEMFADPVRFQSVVDGIAAAQSITLITNLPAFDTSIREKLVALKTYPGDYRDALEELHSRIQKATDPLGTSKKTLKQN